MIFRVIQILLEMWEWLRSVFCMCFVEAFTSLFISPLKFGVLPLPLSFLKGSKNTCLWQVNGSRKPWTVQFLAGTGTSDFLNPYALAA